MIVKIFSRLSIFILILVCQYRLAIAQNNNVAKKEISIKLERVDGFGPNGQMSLHIGSKDCPFY